MHINRLAFLDLNLLVQIGDLWVAGDLPGDFRLQRGDFLFRFRAGVGRLANVGGIHLLAGIDEQAGRAVHFQHAQCALVERAKDRMIHQNIRARHLDLKSTTTAEPGGTAVVWTLCNTLVMVPSG